MASNPNSKRAETGAGKVSPILGLPVDPVDEDEPLIAAVSEEPATAVANQEWPLRLTVIVPARNEEDSLPRCLQSLLQQDSALFRLGEDWELLVVDDGSTDRTQALAEEAFAGRVGARVLPAPALDAKAFTGKSSACWFGAQEARGRTLLFTDADTLHEPASLQHALGEAEKHGAALLSYSPRQIVHGFAQRTVMPLVFSELASVYKMAEVNDPNKRIAAANGQFVLLSRGAYLAVGGHKVLGRSVLEDVDLAFNVKRAKFPIRFRYAPDAVSTQMYRGFGDMVEGWTKNLAQLFPHALGLVAWRLLDIGLLFLPVLLWLMPWLVFWQKGLIVLLWLRTLLRFYRRVARGNFGFVNSAISPLGLPLFCFLLLNSFVRHKILHRVPWKGREYRTGGS